MRKLIALLSAIVAVSSCGIYSFSGTSIQPDVNTITINYFEYKALKVNPSLSNDLTEAVKTRFRQMTRLEQVDMDGDMEITGEVTGYNVAASAIAAGDLASTNRLTITVKVTFINRKYPEDGFENKDFSGYSDYDAVLSLDSVESGLVAEIVDKIVEDIFNATVAQW